MLRKNRTLLLKTTGAKRYYDDRDALMETLLKFFSSEVVQVDIFDPLVKSQVYDIMKIYLDLKDTTVGAGGQKVSTFRKLNKEIMSPLRGNPLYPFF